MSLDYPYYEELCRRKHRAAWWWLVGDWLYYLGLLPGMLALPTAGILFVSWLLGVGEHYLAMAGLAAATHSRLRYWYSWSGRQSNGTPTPWASGTASRPPRSIGMGLLRRTQAPFWELV